MSFLNYFSPRLKRQFTNFQPFFMIQTYLDSWAKTSYADFAVSMMNDAEELCMTSWRIR